MLPRGPRRGGSGGGDSGPTLRVGPPRRSRGTVRRKRSVRAHAGRVRADLATTRRPDVAGGPLLRYSGVAMLRGRHGRGGSRGSRAPQILRSERTILSLPQRVLLTEE